MWPVIALTATAYIGFVVAVARLIGGAVRLAELNEPAPTRGWADDGEDSQ